MRSLNVFFIIVFFCFASNNILCYGSYNAETNINSLDEDWVNVQMMEERINSNKIKNGMRNNHRMRNRHRDDL